MARGLDLLEDARQRAGRQSRGERLGARSVQDHRGQRPEAPIELHELLGIPAESDTGTPGAPGEWSRQVRGERTIAPQPRESLESAIAILNGPGHYLNPYRGKVLALVALARHEEARVLYREVIRYGPRNPEIEAALAQSSDP